MFFGADALLIVQILADNIFSGTVEPQFAVLYPDDAVAQTRYGVHIVRDKDHGPPLLPDIAHLAEAFFLKSDIADRQDLVNDQYFGFEVGGDRECEPHIHTARIVFDWRVEKAFDL